MGKFILNDLLSEGTVYTLDGKNIFDNQYYSFIGMTDTTFYCSSNVPDSSIAKFPRTDLFAVKPKDFEMADTTVLQPVLPQVSPVEEKNPIDVSTVSVAKTDIDDALNSSSSLKSDVLENRDLETKDKVEDVADGSALEFPFPPISIDKDIASVSKEKGSVSSDSILRQEKPQGSFAATSSNFGDLEKKIEVSDKTSDSVFNFSNSTAEEDTNDKSNTSELVDNHETEEAYDVVHAVSDIVQKNKDFSLKILELEKKNESYQEHMQEIEQLRAENSRLLEENRKLRVVNDGLQNAMGQIRQELGISSFPTATENYEYRKVA